MDITKETIVADLVAKDYRTASVFKQNGIDFCCNGQRSIEDACNNEQVESDIVLKALQDVSLQQSDSSIDFNSWPLDLLADYIEKTHHRYVEKKIPEINPYLNKIVQVHGGRHPELAEIADLFQGIAAEMTIHMKKEELMLFPLIRKIEKARQEGTKTDTLTDKVESPIKAMMHDHDTQGDSIKKIVELTDNFTPPADACNTYRVTFALLEEFQDDLFKHIHLENNILFPKAIQLEEMSNVLN